MVPGIYFAEEDSIMTWALITFENGRVELIQGTRANVARFIESLRDIRSAEFA